VGGDGLTTGYLNQPELTDKRFVDDPFRPNERVYKTGDLVVMTPAGDLTFVGREDRQVKRRGFRVELDGIEAHLRRHPLVKQAVVALDDSVVTQRSIRAFYVAEAPLDATAVRAHLLDELPHYALPDHLTQVDSMPLTVNGKVDVAALISRSSSAEVPASTTLGTETERRVAAIWQAVLTERPALGQSFFELGGNSIKLLEVHARLQREFPGYVEVGDLFAFTTVEGLAHFLDRKRARDASSVQTRLLEVPARWRPNGGASVEAAVQVALKGERLRRLLNATRARGVSVTEIAAKAFVASVASLLQENAKAPLSKPARLPCVLRVSGDSRLRWTLIDADGVGERESPQLPGAQAHGADANDGRFELQDLSVWRREQPLGILPVFESVSLQPELKARDVGLVLRVRQAPSSLTARCEYDTARLSRPCAEQLLSHWVNVLESNLGLPDAPEQAAEV
jgi:hypothetical protein